jgi:hypothetical protein
MDTFLENAQRIFDVARADSGANHSDFDNSEFALLVRPDGSLHIVMESASAMNLDAIASENGARTAYRVSKSRDGVRVSGRNGVSRCELSSGKEKLAPLPVPTDLLRDQPLYLIAGRPLLTC